MNTDPRESKDGIYFTCATRLDEMGNVVERVTAWDRIRAFLAKHAEKRPRMSARALATIDRIWAEGGNVGAVWFCDNGDVRISRQHGETPGMHSLLAGKQA